MKIACVDDNKEILQRLEHLLGHYGEKNNTLINCVSFEDLQDFLGTIKDDSFDVVFMDIYFDGQEMTGVEAAKVLRQADPQCIIVFLTSSADHMPEAFAVHAFSYILKDNLDDQLESVIGDAIRVLPEAKSLKIDKGNQTFAIPHHKVICVYSDGHYLNIRILDSAPLRIRMTFRELLDQLEQEERFLQINKGVLVNMDHIQTIEEGDCNMIDGTWLPVRHRDRSSLVATWRAYQFQKIREEQS